MTENPSDPQFAEYRIVIIDAQSMRVVTCASPVGSLLPRASIRVNRRAAEALTDFIECNYGCITIQLTILPSSAERSRCAVHELIKSQGLPSQTLSLESLDGLVASELTDGERACVVKVMRCETTGLGRFARIGWFEELLTKAGFSSGHASMPMFRQLNQGIDFGLISLTSPTGLKVWFKAVGTPNEREFPLTVELATRLPNHLPRLIAKIPEWNGWIAEHVPGEALGETSSILECEKALHALAGMQREMIGSKPFLLSIGAKDYTCARVESLVAPFFEEAHCAMRQQTSTKAQRLHADELDALASGVQSALGEFGSSGIPETLVHGDIGHGNIIVAPNGPIFLDWAETCIGHPFLSAEHLLAGAGRSCQIPHSAWDRARLVYSEHWRDYTTPRTLARTNALAPAVAAFVYAVMAWEAFSQQAEPARGWPLLRSLLRRTRLELEKSQDVAV